MICQSCLGKVIWKGKVTNLTHTECVECGAVNNQLSEPEEDDADELNCKSIFSYCDDCNGSGWHFDRECSACSGIGGKGATQNAS